MIGNVGAFGYSIASWMGGKIKTGAEFGSRTVYVLFKSTDGIEKVTKAALSILKASPVFFLSSKGQFDKCIGTLEAEKDLLYATQFFATLETFINDGNLTFTYPKINGRPDFAKIILGIGTFFELGQFLQKYQILSFSLCSELANTYGSYQIFRDWPLDSIPVLRSVLDKPKDLFVFFGSFGEIIECLLRWRFDVKDLLKIASSTGKMLIIFFGKEYGGTWWFAVIDIATQHVSLAAYVYKCHLLRQQHFNH